MTRSLSAIALVLMLTAGLATPVAAQQGSNQTQALAKQLTDLMQAQKLDAVATRLGEDHFAAVLFIPGVQMLVVSARYGAPPLLNEKIIGRQYRDVYLDLASASIPDSKLFIEDMQANGLRPDRAATDDQHVRAQQHRHGRRPPLVAAASPGVVAVANGATGATVGSAQIASGVQQVPDGGAAEESLAAAVHDAGAAPQAVEVGR